MSPQIPKEKAVNFLQGYEGEAWVVPEATGQYVIAMPKEKNMCFVYAYRARQEKTLKVFTAMANAPAGSFHIKKGKRSSRSRPRYLVRLSRHRQLLKNLVSQILIA